MCAGHSGVVRALTSEERTACVVQTPTRVILSSQAWGKVWHASAPDAAQMHRAGPAPGGLKIRYPPRWPWQGVCAGVCVCVCVCVWCVYAV